ncbi:hypothetical protein [Mycolicibacterium llatzerense]|uniref:hypothetical protein n=1 Tax=Mycolicibacterium llatzerense TaxID=280871 RepID=UPI0008DDA3DE|nr:hypothetical protein [Mycolicibacterium llatzerense]
MRQLPTENVLLDARFHLQLLGEHCATDDYIRLTERVDQIEKLSPDTPLADREQYRQALLVHRQIVEAVRRRAGGRR